MFSPLVALLMQYGTPVLAGLLIGLVCKRYFSSRLEGKIREYKIDIVKSHEIILDLEAKNYQLEKRLKEVEGVYKKDRLFMN